MPDGQLAHNIMQFCRALRAAGLPIGPGQALAALSAVEVAGIGRREDLYWALHASLINRRDQRDVFDQAFHLFWRNPELLKRAMNLMLPQVKSGRDEDARELSRRVAEAFAPARQPGMGDTPPESEDPELLLDATLSFSDSEQLRGMDFEKMSTAELAEARRMLATLSLPLPDIRTRRYAADARARRIDMRRTLRASLRGGGAVIDLAYRSRTRRSPPLVVLCDISGSMASYSKMLLHFLHAVSTDRQRLHCFVFGTRLTNVTRQLRHRDVDEALARVGEVVQDWSGGTRIGDCLDEFNRLWSRRVLGQGADVLLISDGLDRGQPERLAKAMDRLHRSCRRLVWLNPLLRYDLYAPKSQGARAMIAHVDAFRSAHNIDSLAALGQVLSTPPGGPGPQRWKLRAASREATA